MPETIIQNPINSVLDGVPNATDSLSVTWDDIVASKIYELTQTYGVRSDITNILYNWHRDVTLGYKKDKSFVPHVNGFYMIFMVHGTWYNSYLNYVKGKNNVGLSKLPDAGEFDKSGQLGNFTLSNPNSYMNMLATDIEVPDITEEYVSVSSRLRNSNVPSRNYFVSDFSISYIENANLDIMRYHEGWHKYLNLIKRGEINPYSGTNPCPGTNSSYFLDMPYSNAVWVAVFKPFTTEIQLLIKLMGVMPVTMPLKQVIGNRSSSKMTVLNISYKAADLFYKFYNSTQEFLNDDGMLAKSFREEVMHQTSN